MELYKLREAAAEIGVSYPTLKQWIYKGKVRSVKTPGGHHRIPRAEIDRLVGGERDRSPRPASPVGLEAISGRNKLLGTVVDVRFDGLLAQVMIDIHGQTIVSIITRDSCQRLGLEKGVEAFALIKATEVMVIRA
jgi:molybdopterin-binding protein